MTLPAANLLAEEASPYLRQHAANPVHWRPWSQAALAEARLFDRPILLSVGYSACHWCHVMAHESFENPDIAAVMNRLYVNIKVDREERPDIDQIYMAALSATGEQGGWPLTMFLTPDAQPFWGGTYFPPTPRHGRPGFAQVLASVHDAWLTRRHDVTQNAGILSRHVGSRLAAAAAPQALEHNQLSVLADGIHLAMDDVAGGLRGAPKFPNAPFLCTLWLSWLRDRKTDHRDAVLLTLRRMLTGGIYDHVGGGMARYSTDADWLVPHFEKMLYDNAQLLRLLNWAYAETGDELFRIRIEQTAAWLIRDMSLPDGGFASSLDADSAGEEGKFYTWTRAELATVLGDGADRLLEAFSLASPADWHGEPILHQSAAQVPRYLERFHAIAPLLDRLRTARSTRIPPGRDDKLLVDWNGLAIEALADVGRAFNRPDWIQAAAIAFKRILGAVDADNRLPHSILGAARLFPAMSTDYAAMANAAFALHQATGLSAYLDDAAHLLEKLDRWHADPTGTGHFLTASDSSDVPVRIRGDVDEAIPSATGQITDAFARLAIARPDPNLSDRLDALAQQAMGRASAQPYGQAGIVNACALAGQMRKLVVVDDPAQPVLIPVANRYPDPRRLDFLAPLGSAGAPIQVPGNSDLPTDHIGAWLCTATACQPPLYTPERLADALRGSAG